MLFKLFLLAGTVAAVARPAAPVASTTAGGCSLPASISSVIDTIPTPPSDLESAISAITNYCVSPTFTGPLLAEWTSYEAAVLSWNVANSAVLASAESACPTLGGGAPACVSGVSNGGGGSAGSASSSTHKGAAPMATMMAGAGAVLAGVVGVLAL